MVEKNLNYFKKYITLWLLMCFISSYAQDPSNQLKPLYDKDLEIEVCDELSKQFIDSDFRQPVLLLIGGFQGSGKSSLIERIQNASKVNIISTDAIRYNLFNRGVKISPEFSKYLICIYENLVKRSLSSNTNTIVDANAHSKRLGHIDKLLQENKFEHQVVKIFLKTPETILRERIRARCSVPGKYQGTEEELEASLLSSNIDERDYDLVIETDKASEEKVYELVVNYLSDIKLWP